MPPQRALVQSEYKQLGIKFKFLPISYFFDRDNYKLLKKLILEQLEFYNILVTICLEAYIYIFFFFHRTFVCGIYFSFFSSYVCLWHAYIFFFLIHLLVAYIFFFIIHLFAAYIYIYIFFFFSLYVCLWHIYIYIYIYVKRVYLGSKLLLRQVLVKMMEHFIFNCNFSSFLVIFLVSGSRW